MISIAIKNCKENEVILFDNDEKIGRLKLLCFVSVLRFNKTEIVGFEFGHRLTRLKQRFKYSLFLFTSLTIPTLKIADKTEIIKRLKLDTD
jgi:hypothetical protein